MSALGGNTAGDDGGLAFVVIVVALGVLIFKVWMMVARPDVYRAQLEERRHRREQRNRRLGPALGSGFQIISYLLTRRR